MSTTDEDIYESFNDGGDTSDGNDSEGEERPYKENLERLKGLLERVHWQVAEETYRFFNDIFHLFGNWKGRIPNLRNIIRNEQMDCLLSVAVIYKHHGDNNFDRGKLIIEFVIKTDYKDQPDVDKDGKPLSRRFTAVHCAARHGYFSDVRELFQIYNKFGVNYSDKSGLTHFHAACMSGCVEVVKKFLEFGQDPNFRPEESVDPPLHLALTSGRREATKIAESLLKIGANPNLANFNGLTPLHLICTSRGLLYKDDFMMLKMLFDITDSKYQTLEIDAQDKWGRTPLHLALAHCHDEEIVRLLMTRGANPNLSDVNGLTPLHIICQKSCETSWVEMFFKISDDRHRTLQLDVRDKWGRTPLQLAAAYLLPNTLNILLDRGADLSSFVFLNEGHLEITSQALDGLSRIKLGLAYAALTIVDHLENRGYKMNRSDALKVMNVFAKHGIFQRSECLEFLRNDKEFVGEAKQMMVIPNLSLYKLIRLRPKLVEKLLTRMDYLKFACESNYYLTLSEEAYQACTEYLGEIMSRGFFRRWALDAILDLTGKRLPSFFHSDKSFRSKLSIVSEKKTKITTKNKQKKSLVTAHSAVTHRVTTHTATTTTTTTRVSQRRDGAAGI
uniref:Uncharacterized protein n=1 Tax=Trichogramma kaykai TaxID=54128 RepID=A0ABD2X426_9HYME